MKKLLSIIMTSVMALTLVITALVPAGKVQAQETTTVYYGFGTVESFVPGETYMFLADSAGVNVDVNTCLLGLPSGTGTVKATSEENSAKDMVESFDITRQIEDYNRQLQWLEEDKDSYIHMFQSYYEQDSEWYTQRYGNKTPEEVYESECQRYKDQIASLQKLENVQMTVSAYVDVVERGEGFDGCEKGALCNGGSFYFCDGGGVQGLSGKVFTYKTAQITTSDLSATLNSQAVEKVQSGLLEATKDDVTVLVTVDGKECEVHDYEFTDNTIDTQNGDDTIVIKFGDTTAEIKVDLTSAVAPVEAAMVSGRDGSVTAEQLKINNAATVVQPDSVADRSDKTVNEVIDILASNSIVEKNDLVMAATQIGDLKVAVDNKDANKVSGSVNITNLALSALTGQELVDVLTGNDNISLTLEISATDENALDKSLKNDVVEKAKASLGDGSQIYFIDVDLYIAKNAEARQKIDDFGTNSVGITLSVPKQVLSVSKNIKLIRTHEEKNGVLSVDALDDLDSVDETYTIDTNKLCVMAFAYADTPISAVKTATAPKTGDSSDKLLLLLAGAVIVFALGADSRRREYK